MRNHGQSWLSRGWQPWLSMRVPMSTSAQPSTTFGSECACSCIQTLLPRQPQKPNHPCQRPPVSRCISDIHARLAPPWPRNVRYVPAPMSRQRLNSQVMVGSNVASAAFLSATLAALTDMLSNAVQPDVHRWVAVPVLSYGPRPTEAPTIPLNQLVLNQQIGRTSALLRG